ncbi:MAG: cation:proton antiporter, partial [bacterium]
MDAPEHIPLLVLLVGLIIVISILIRSFLVKIRVPSMIGFFILGFSLRVVNSSFQILSPVDLDVFDFLAKIGVIVLLFRIGLESNLSGLISQFRHAVVNWISDFLISGLIGFFVAYTLFDLSLIPSLFVGIALTATSVGISVGVWQEAKALKTPTGELLTDVAELDDISGIVAMAILFAVIPVLKNGTEGNQLTGLMVKSAGWILIKL